MNNIKIIEIRTEFGAGTRGASLGIDAIKLASTKFDSNFFLQYPTTSINMDSPQTLLRADESKTAKYLDKVLEVEEKICREIASASLSNFLVVMGGDHSVGGGTLGGIKKAHLDKRIGVIWIDAHADLNTPYTTPSGNVHGMPLAMSLSDDNKEKAIHELTPEVAKSWEKMKNIGGEGAKIDPKDIVFIGLRSVDDAENFLIEKHGIKVFEVEEARKKSIKKIVNETLEYLLHCDVICISFDVDSMDPDKVSKGTGTPVSGGFTKEEAIELNVGLVKDPKVVSWEIVEVNPLLDHDNRMGEAAFQVLETVARAKA